MVIRYYLCLLICEKILNVKRWKMEFEIILKYMENSDCLYIVSLCFEFINAAVDIVSILIDAFHGRIFISIVKCLIRICSQQNCDLFEHQTQVKQMAKETILHLFVNCESIGHQEKFVSVLNEIANIDIVQEFVHDCISDCLHQNPNVK